MKTDVGWQLCASQREDIFIAVAAKPRTVWDEANGCKELQKAQGCCDVEASQTLHLHPCHIYSYPTQTREPGEGHTASPDYRIIEKVYEGQQLPGCMAWQLSPSGPQGVNNNTQ